MEGGSSLTPMVPEHLPIPLITGRRIGTKTCGVGHVFPPDDLIGVDTYLNYALILIYIQIYDWWGVPRVSICIEMFDWWERNDLWWPALSGHWLSCTGCCQYLLIMKCLIHGLLFLHLSTIDFLYIIFTNKLSIIRRRVSGLATVSPCSVWGHGWTTCLWLSNFRFMFLNDSWCVTLT